MIPARGTSILHSVGEKRYRMTDGAAVVNLQLWCDVAFSDKTYPKKAVIEMYADGNFVREFPYTSLMSAMEDREDEAYLSGDTTISFGHQFTCYQYIQETVKSENIKKNSNYRSRTKCSKEEI